MDEDAAQITGHSKIDPSWNWEEAEKRLQTAYDRGGFPAWAHVVAREIEAERHVERTRPERELKQAKGEKPVS
jgi:hypothetical protein